jgi:D-alanyl-lipoteichoic acid acyltransferase DltB (MBOAT superfamily)
MSYTIDIYKGKLMPVKNVFHFFAYLSMFPQLVAGPIIRAKDLLKQLSVYRPVSDLMFWNGLKLIVIGFFQKTVLADNIATLVNYSFNNVEKYNGFLFWWIVVIAFAFQIYFDFSGYSLIARGLAKWMGLHFKINFNHPYLANSLKDFWQRWHISLSTWFRDYVYIPLGGNKKGKLLSHLFMWITMVLSGIWHGVILPKNWTTG